MLDKTVLDNTVLDKTVLDKTVLDNILITPPSQGGSVPRSGWSAS